MVDPKVCIEKKYSHTVDNFFSGGPTRYNGYSHDIVQFSELDGDGRTVCLTDAEEALRWLRGQGRYGDNYHYRYWLSSHIETIPYYKEGGEIKFLNAGDPEKPWYEAMDLDPAAKILFQSLKTYVELPWKEQLRFGKLCEFREIGIGYIHRINPDLIEEGKEPTDEKLCEMIVKSVGKGKILLKDEVFTVTYLDMRGKYKGEVVASAFNSIIKNYREYDKEDFRNILWFYDMLNPAQIEALYRKYPETPIYVWNWFSDIKGIGKFYRTVLKDKRHSAENKAWLVRQMLDHRFDEKKYKTEPLRVTGQELCEFSIMTIDSMKDRDRVISNIIDLDKDKKFGASVVDLIFKYNLLESDVLLWRALENYGSVPKDVAGVEALYKKGLKNRIPSLARFVLYDGIDNFYHRVMDGKEHTNVAKLGFLDALLFYCGIEKDDKYKRLQMMKVRSGEKSDLSRFNKHAAFFRHVLEAHPEIFGEDEKLACLDLLVFLKDTPPNAETVRRVVLAARPEFAEVRNLPFMTEALLVDLALVKNSYKAMEFAVDHKWENPGEAERLWTGLTKDEDDVYLFGLLTNTDLSRSATIGKEGKALLEKLVVEPIRQKDAEKVYKLFSNLAPNEVPYKGNGLGDLAKIILKNCTPDEIMWLYDIQTAREYVEGFLADGLAEVYLREKNFVRLFEISQQIQGDYDFWKRFFFEVIKYKDDPRLEHVLCLDVVLKHAQDNFFEVTESGRQRNMADSLQMVQNHLKGKELKFYQVAKDDVGWGIYHDLLGAKFFKEAMDKTRLGDPDGFVFLTSLLGYYAHLCEYLQRWGKTRHDPEVQELLGLMDEYLMKCLGSLILVGMDDATREKVVEASLKIYNFVLENVNWEKQEEYRKKCGLIFANLTRPICGNPEDESKSYRSYEHSICTTLKTLGMR